MVNDEIKWSDFVWGSELDFIFSVISVDEMKRLRGIFELMYERNTFEPFCCGSLHFLIGEINKELMKRRERSEGVSAKE